MRPLPAALVPWPLLWPLRSAAFHCAPRYRKGVTELKQAAYQAGRSRSPGRAIAAEESSTLRRGHPGAGTRIPRARLRIWSSGIPSSSAARSELIFSFLSIDMMCRSVFRLMRPHAADRPAMLGYDE